MSDKDGFSFKWGAVTLIDFLGWKGVWMNDYKKQSQSNRIFNLDSLASLAKLIDEADEICRMKWAEYTEKNGIVNCQLTSENGYSFISISDTIAMFTPCDNEESKNYDVLKQHSEICSTILEKSANAGFALRGAITIGDYACLNNIIVGPGVDECTSWYEQTDWLGIIFAPSAQFAIDEMRRKNGEMINCQSYKLPINKDENSEEDKIWCDSKIVEYPHIPIKNGVRGIKYCVDWGNEANVLNKILKNTISLSKDIAIKHINTNNYLYALRPKYGNEIKQV